MMDCSNARTYFPLLTLPPVGEVAAELQAAQQHLEQCAVCRSALRPEAAGDRELSLLMSDVSLPDGLSARLLQQQVAAQPVLPPAGRATRTRRRHWFWASTAAAVLILAVSSLWLARTFSPATIAVTDLLAMIQPHHSLADWPVSPPRDLPSGWSDSVQFVTQPYRWKSDAAVPLYAADFEFRPGRGVSPVTGTLWMVEAGQVSDAGELPTLESAQIDYRPDYGLLIWRENATVYIVTMEGRGLELILTKLRSSRSLA